MEENLSPLAITHLLQHTLRSLCVHDNTQWVYAVFWRILPRNYPPPKWDGQGAYDRSRGNRRNWILVWEDGFCNFAASTKGGDLNTNECSDSFKPFKGLQPELFFKMSHEIYNYGEGLIGKVAADHSHKWIYKEPNEQEINYLSTWHNSVDFQPRTWEAQFQSGIKTIALIAVREGVVQLGAVQKVIEDLNDVVMLRKKFSYIESIPGVLLPHPSSSSSSSNIYEHPQPWCLPAPPPPADHLYEITPSMSSLEALLSKLPSVVPPPSPPTSSYYNPTSQLQSPQQFVPSYRLLESMEMEKVKTITKEEMDEDECRSDEHDECTTSSMATYHHHHQHFNGYIE